MRMLRPGRRLSLIPTQPVFFCRDPIQGPDVIRSQYRNPQNFLLDHNSLFDLLANTPEGYVFLRPQKDPADSHQ